MSPRFLAVWFALALAAALVSRGELRGLARERCALDGLALLPAARVDLFEGPGAGLPAASFCSVACALAFAAAKPSRAPRRFEVHDEQDGAALDPAAATFVRAAASRPGGRAVLRAFRDPVAAAAHAASAAGLLVPNPFPRASLEAR